MLWGGALEVSWSAVQREGEGPGSCTFSNFRAHSLLDPTDCSFFFLKKGHLNVFVKLSVGVCSCSVFVVPPGYM